MRLDHLLSKENLGTGTHTCFEESVELLFNFEGAAGYGGVAQLGEHLPCKQGVMGSNPIISTRIFRVGNRMGVSALPAPSLGFEKDQFRVAESKQSGGLFRRSVGRIPPAGYGSLGEIASPCRDVRIQSMVSAQARKTIPNQPQK